MQQFTRAAMLLCALGAGLQAQAQDAGAAKPATPKLGGFTPPASSSGTEVDAIAVVVNDDVITKNELAARIVSVERRMREQGAQMPDPADLRRQILERMIVERAQLQLGKEMGVRVDDGTLDRALGRIAESQKMNIQELRNQVEKDGGTYAGFREEIRSEIIMQRVREHEVDNKIQVSDAEVDTFLVAEAAAAKDLVELNLAQIIVRIPENASPEQIAARKARADEVMRQLRTGADFAKAAATYSDAADALKGGEVGWRPTDRLPPLFSDALAKLNVGQVTQVIKTPAGFYILKVLGKRNAADAQDKTVVQQTRARHILLKLSPSMTAADAKRKLLELKERLDNKAAKFEELARLFSNDASAAKGGDTGWLAPGDTVPEFETAMNALKIGEISAPVETTFGFHLIEVLERKSDDTAKDTKRNAARDAIRERKLGEATEEWLRQVRDRAYVEFRSEEK